MIVSSKEKKTSRNKARMPVLTLPLHSTFVAKVLASVVGKGKKYTFGKEELEPRL